MSCTAVLLSGGIGSRIASENPKQYLLVGGKMIVTHTLTTLLQAPEISDVIIVAAEEWQERILFDAEKNDLSTEKIRDFAAPGRTRQESIANALNKLLRKSGGMRELKAESESELILIHDAARPCVSTDLIRHCFEALGTHDGVMPYLPMRDTVYLADDAAGRIEACLKRSRVVAGQAPELFRLKKYEQALSALPAKTLRDVSGTAEPAVLAGLDIVLIPGEERNLKITTESDLTRFRELMEYAR